MQHPMELVDWHWDEPFWPAAGFATTAGRTAAMLTIHRCFWCGEEFSAGGSTLQDASVEVLRRQPVARLERHTRERHPRQPLRYTVYPPSFGLRVVGRDA